MNHDGGVVFKKYAPVAMISNFAEAYAEVLYNNSGHSILISDQASFVAVAGISKTYLHTNVGAIVQSAMDQTETVMDIRKGTSPFDSHGPEDTRGYIITPIMAHGTPKGAVIMIRKKEVPNEYMTSVLTETAAHFFAQQIE